MNIFSNMLFLPVVALGVAEMMAVVMPGLPRIPVALAVIAGSTLTALLDIRVNALVTGIFLAVEVVALAVLAWLGFAESVRPLGDMLVSPLDLIDGVLAPASPAAIGLATTIAIFAFNGYGMAVYFGEEMQEAPRRVGKVVLLALLLTLVSEALPVVAVLQGAPDLVALFASDDPFGMFTREAAGSTASLWMAAAVTVAMVNAAIVAILACARFFYATGRDRAWGRRFDALMGSVHPRFGSPWAGTLLTGGVGALCCFVDLRFLLVLSGTGLIATYAAISLAALLGRRNGASAHARYRMPLFPIAPLFTLAALAGVTWANWLDVEEGRPGLIATTVQMTVAAAYYLLVLRKRGWSVKDPTG